MKKIEILCVSAFRFFSYILHIHIYIYIYIYIYICILYILVFTFLFLLFFFDNIYNILNYNSAFTKLSWENWMLQQPLFLKMLKHPVLNSLVWIMESHARPWSPVFPRTYVTYETSWHAIGHLSHSREVVWLTANHWWSGTLHLIHT